MLKILVIEDETAIRNNLARFLRAEGYEVATAENGVLGVAAARRPSASHHLRHSHA
jgi:DNA-binding response OmpR family regulator